MNAGPRRFVSQNVHRVAVALTTLLAALAPTSALAHGAVPTGPRDLWRSWNLEPLVLIGLTLAACSYVSGRAELRRRVRSGRVVCGWQAAAYASGILALFVALVSPLDPFGEALFAAHMTQHLLLVLVAPPFLLLGRPLVPVLWSLPIAWRRWLGGHWRGASMPRRFWRGVTQPVVAWSLHVAAIWIWHLPGLYEAAIGSDAIHLAEHAAFLGSALLYWWTILAPAQRRVNPLAILSLFGMAMQSTALGVLITFAGTAWYPIYEASEAAWGVNPLTDQQLAGLIMWVPAAAVYTTAALAVFVRWLAESEREAARRERLALGQQGEARV